MGYYEADFSKQSRIKVYLKDGRILHFYGETATDLMNAMKEAGVTANDIQNTIHIIPKGTLKER